MAESCKSCVYMYSLMPERAVCRRNPPVALNGSRLGSYPGVLPGFWCGEYTRNWKVNELHIMLPKTVRIKLTVEN